MCNGSQLELTCTTTGDFLQWRFSVIRGNETSPTTVFTRTIISVFSASNAISQSVVNSTVFTFSKLSAEDNLPVVSRLLISPVSWGLNGTEMSCRDLTTSETAVTIIKIIDDHLQGKIKVKLIMLASYPGLPVFFYIKKCGKSWVTWLARLYIAILH